MAHRDLTSRAIGGHHLRVVHAVWSTTFAGVERYLAAVSNVLAGRGHDLVVVTNDPRPVQEALFGSPVRVVGTSGIVGFQWKLARQTLDADIVHTHMTAAETAAVLAQPFAGAPIVTTRHFPWRRGSSVLGRAAAPLVSRNVAAEIAISEFVAHSVPESTEIVLNGVADAPQAPLEAPVVLVVQRLEREKHTADALTAWIASGLALEGWELWVIGHGSERHLLEEMASRGACSGVRFFGQRSDVAELHKAASVLLAPAPTEPFGMSVAEAMAAGMPVVAAGGGGHLETVGAVFPDLLFPPHDIRACAELLRRLAYLDPAGRRAIGEALRQFQQEKFGLERHADELTAVYERVAGEHRPSRRRRHHVNSATARSAGGERPQQLGRPLPES